jgi:hypothetical protein
MMKNINVYMKNLLLIIVLFCTALVSHGQEIYQIRADSVRIYSDCDTAEFILENRTQMVPGYLFNKGYGRTEFRRMQLSDLGNGVISIKDQDTLDLSLSLSENFIRNQFALGQQANYWINGTGRVDKDFYLGSGMQLNKFKNNASIDSVLTTDINGNVRLKYVNTDGFWSSSSSAIYNNNTTGNVAIGTSSASERLTVNGNIRADILKLQSVSGATLIPLIVVGSSDTLLRINNNTLLMGSDTRSIGGSDNFGIGTSVLNGNTTGSGNLGIGRTALTSNTSGQYNTAVGAYTLRFNTVGRSNTAVGYAPLTSNTTGNNNNALGNQSLRTNTTGNDNNAFGFNALCFNVAGSNNSAFGSYALYSSIGASNNAFGYQSLRTNTSGSSNTAFGSSSLLRNLTGSANSAFGNDALSTNVTGLNNVGIGASALYILSYGSSNTAIGVAAGSNHKGSNSIFIGSLANTATPGDSIDNVTVIAYNTVTSIPDVVGLGRANQNVIIGAQSGGTGMNYFSTNSGEKLQVSGNVRIAGNIRLPIRTVTGSSILTSNDYTVLVNNASAVSITLPAPASNTGAVLNIKKVSNNESGVTLVVAGGATIDAAASYVMSTYNKNIQLQCDGTSWYILTGL